MNVGNGMSWASTLSDPYLFVSLTSTTVTLKWVEGSQRFKDKELVYEERKPKFGLSWGNRRDEGRAPSWSCFFFPPSFAHRSHPRSSSTPIYVVPTWFGSFLGCAMVVPVEERNDGGRCWWEGRGRAHEAIIPLCSSSSGFFFILIKVKTIKWG